MGSAGPPSEGTQTNGNNSDSDFIWCPVRLYGNAVQGDPCFVSFICIPCAEKSDDDKIKKALEK
jgi:hypothetical protein